MKGREKKKEVERKREGAKEIEGRKVGGSEEELKNGVLKL